MTRAISSVFLVPIQLLLIGCNMDSEVRNTEKQEPTPAVELAAQSKSDAANLDVRVVTNLYRTIDRTTEERDALVCDGWSYSDASLLNDFPQMKEATIEEWGRQCYQYSCEFEGRISIGTTGNHKVTVNAGGWISLQKDGAENVRYFISETKMEAFLDSCDCCEEL